MTPFPHIDLLKQMVAIPAISRQEKQRASFLEAFLSDWGWKVERFHNNLLMGDPDAPGYTLLLNSHIDTVPPVEGWQQDPHTPEHEGGQLRGLGTNDAGASVVCLAAVYHELAEALKGRLNLLLLLSAEEEVSGTQGIEAVLPRLGKVDGAIVGEPTNMKAAIAERGLMVLDGEVEGLAGHAAREEGENAIYKAMDEVRNIASLEFPKPSRWLPPASAQVTMISAGTGHNVVPDLCRFVVDVRSNDQYGNEELLELICQGSRARLTPRSTRLKPSRLPEAHPMMQVIRDLNLGAFGSSTMSDMALIPFPAVKMGPGHSQRSHTAGEFIREDELSQGIALYREFIIHLAETIPH